jgi:large subunit ribosomal protein L4e
MRAGKGKMRNRRFVQRRGPLVIYDKDDGIVKAFRNLPGVDICQVDRLNLLQLAPGGHVGRFMVWTESAVAKLDGIYGTGEGETPTKKKFLLPRSIMANSDVARIINSDEIQSIIRPIAERRMWIPRKKNPLRNKEELFKLNPHARVAKVQKEKKLSKGKVDKSIGKKFYETMISN